MGAKANTPKCLQQRFAYTGVRTPTAFVITTSKTLLFTQIILAHLKTGKQVQRSTHWKKIHLLHSKLVFANHLFNQCCTMIQQQASTLRNYSDMQGKPALLQNQLIASWTHTSFKMKPIPTIPSPKPCFFISSLQ